MDIEFLFLAKSAYQDKSGLNIQGCGITQATALSFPAVLSLVLVFSIKLWPDEAKRNHNIEVTCHGKGKDPIGKAQPMGTAREENIFDAQAPVFIKAWVSLDFASLPEPGVYEFRVAVDTRTIKSVRLWVHQEALRSVAVA